jgi:hypothetical protein
MSRHQQSKRVQSVIQRGILQVASMEGIGSRIVKTHRFEDLKCAALLNRHQLSLEFGLF